MPGSRWSAPQIESLVDQIVHLKKPLPEIEISMAWHPRHDADPAHRWFRAQIRANGAAHLLSIDPWTCAPVLSRSAKTDE